MNALRRVNVTPGNSVEMTDVAPQSSTAKASEEVEKLQKSYDALRANLAEDHPVLKHCLEDLEKARKQSNAQAQLVDEKHVTEALIQANKYLTSTSETFAKGDQLEQDRLSELKNAVADQEAYIAQRNADCQKHIQAVKTTITTLEAMKVHLLAKAPANEPPPAQPALVEVAVPVVPSDTLAALHKIFADTQMPTEVAAKLKESVNTLLAPQAQPSTYGKVTTAVSPAANAARTGPYETTPGNATGTEQPEVEEHPK